jgi:hypothetical protein
MINKQTSLDLNGPILSFVINPESKAVCSSGIATFVGLATATFPSQTPTNPAVPTGYISYKWHIDGYGELNDGILNGMTIVGSSTTTLTISNITDPVTYNNSKIFLRSDYIPSAYSQPSGSDVTSVTSRSTGNAINDPKDSELATLSVYPNIVVTKNPESVTTGQGIEANFSVEATTTDPSQASVSYQWQLNGKDLVDGVGITSTPKPQSTYESNSVLILPLNSENGTTLSLKDYSKTTKTITGGGSWGSSPSWVVGKGKFYPGAAFFDGTSYLNVPASNDFYFATGDFTIELWVNFDVQGIRTWEVLVGVGGGYYGDGGTWFTVLRDNTSSNSPASFYLADLAGYISIGSISDLKLGTWRHLAVSKNSSGVKFFVDGKLIKTTNITGWSNQSFGGSALGYIGLEHATFHNTGYYYPYCYMQDIKIYKGAAKYTTDFTPSEVSIMSALTETSVVITSSISGSKTSNLNISLSNTSSNTIRAKVTHPTSCDSPTYSSSANFNVVESRFLLGIEGYDPSISTATLVEKELQYDIPYTIDSTLINSDTICLYAKERDLLVEIDMYGAKGSDNGSVLGGEGGYSKVGFVMGRNDEFIVKGIRSNSAIYLYRKSKLLAVVGQGGNAGSNSRGGFGGGINIAGQNGSGSSGGAGGKLIQSGQLSVNGQFGSSSNTSLIYPEDVKQTGTLGGTTIACSKGVYWRDQGKSPCEELGSIKFRLSDGTEVSNSAKLNRGFKDGYSINQTAGSASSPGGRGGNGATGGSGGSSGSGGGGGSGYTDNNNLVVYSTSGGNTGNSKIVITLKRPLGDFYVDPAGRILILSASTPGKNPTTLTKTTGKVLPGTDSCIDDVRWQNFLNLASTTDGYRLTVTLDNSTTKIINASDNNIRRMINGNYIPLKTSLTNWQLVPYSYTLYALAWDETSIDPGFGGDYSILSWGGTSYYYGYYGGSSNPFFVGTTYGHTTANFWILPPGVPDFP